MKYKLLLLICLFVIGTGVIAQSVYQWKTASSGGYTYKYVTNDPSKSRFYTLSNGLTVILSQNQQEPVIEFRLAVRAGSNTDPKTATGLAHYLEHMLFKGTDKFGTLDYAREKPLLDQIAALYEQYHATTDPVERKNIYAQIDKVSGEASRYAIAGEYDKMMRAIGGKSSNAHTWHEETVYQEDFPSNAVDQFLALQAERFRNPVFRLFHTELETVYEEKNRSLDNDERKVNEQTMAKLFPTHNYGQQTTIGTIEHLKNPSLIEIRNYYNKYYVPNNMLIALSGDFDPDILVRKIDSAFSYMKAKPLTLYNPAPEKPLTQIQRVDVDGPGAESVKLSYRGPAQGTNQSILLDLIAGLLSNGKAGIIDINLEQRQKVQSANAGYLQMKDYGVFSLSATPKQGQTLEEVQKLLMAQVNLLKKGDFDESLIKATVANHKLNQLKDFDQNGFRASVLTREFILDKGAGWNKTLQRFDVMARVTKRQVIDFANRFFKDNYVVSYKHKGEDRNLVKVEKPVITPVHTNPDASSGFAEKLIAMPVQSIAPGFMDYKKDLNFGKDRIADIVTVQNTDNSIFTLTYKFDIGSWNIPMLNYAAQYLTFLGTDKYSADEIKRQYYNIACNYTFSAGGEAAAITISGLQENFDKAVRLTEHMFASCKANEEALSELKNGVMTERENNKSDKDYIQTGLETYALYGANNPFNTDLSNEEVRQMTSAQLLTIIHNFSKYKHDITYYGPKTGNEFTRDISQLHHLPDTFTPAPPAKVFTYAPLTTSQVYFADYDMVQSEVHWVRNAGVYDRALDGTITLFNSYFGDGMGSVVFQSIRESKALAYSTEAYFISPGKKEKQYEMNAYVGCQADKMNEAIGSMNALLNNLPVSDKAFTITKENVLNILATSRIPKSRMISSYFADKRHGWDHDSRIDKYAAVKKLTFADIKAFHEQNVAAKPYNYCIVASGKKVKPEELQLLGVVRKLTLEQIFGY